MAGILNLTAEETEVRRGRGFSPRSCKQQSQAGNPSLLVSLSTSMAEIADRLGQGPSLALSVKGIAEVKSHQPLGSLLCT